MLFSKACYCCSCSSDWSPAWGGLPRRNQPNLSLQIWKQILVWLEPQYCVKLAPFPFLLHSVTLPWVYCMQAGDSGPCHSWDQKTPGV